MDWRTIVIIVLIVIGVAVRLSTTMALRRSAARSMLEPAGTRFGLEPAEPDGDDEQTAVLSGDWQGARVRMTHHARPWYQPDEVELRLHHPLPLAGTVRFHRNTRGHRLARAIGLIPDLEPADRNLQ